jgi:transposase
VTPKLAAWLVERLEVFRPLILAVDQAVRQLSQRIETDAPKPLPKGMGSLTHENIETEVADWTRFSNRRQAGSYAGPSGAASASGQTAADLSITKAGNRRLRTDVAGNCFLDAARFSAGLKSPLGRDALGLEFRLYAVPWSHATPTA